MRKSCLLSNNLLGFSCFARDQSEEGSGKTVKGFIRVIPSISSILYLKDKKKELT